MKNITSIYTLYYNSGCLKTLSTCRHYCITLTDFVTQLDKSLCFSSLILKNACKTSSFRINVSYENVLKKPSRSSLTRELLYLKRRSAKNISYQDPQSLNSCLVTTSKTQMAAGFENENNSLISTKYKNIYIYTHS